MAYKNFKKFKNHPQNLKIKVTKITKSYIRRTQMRKWAIVKIAKY
jgi:hypothetical protein